jgi:hypothetical protein
MSNANVNTIKLDSTNGVEISGTAATTNIFPGMLLRVSAISNDVKTLAIHNEASGDGPCILALEDRYSGDSTTGGGTNVAWPNASMIEAEIPVPGALRGVYLKASENVAIGDRLVSGGDGTFIKVLAFNTATGKPWQVFAIAEEASNTGTAQLIRARIC